MPLTRPKAHQLSGQSAKSSVRVVTTSNVTLSGGAPATVDGVSLTLEDRILVTGQTDATENGIYRVTTVGSGSNGTWVRGRDANQNEEVLAGMTCMVSEGTTYADTFWKLTTDGAVTLGTTELVFAQHSSGGGSGITYTAQASAPSSPSVGDKWYDTGDDILFEYTNDGTSNVWVDISSASTGDSTTGDYAITGNLTAGGNVATGNVTVTDSTISATGNITGGNVISSGSISAGGNYLSSQPSFRNLIINGDMRVNQRGTSVTSSGYTVDRWGYYGNLASKATVAGSSTAPPGYTNSLLATSSSAYSVAATDIFVLRQYIEGNNIAHLGWGTANAKTVTLSFWVRSSLTGTFGGVLKNAAEDRCYPYSYTISSANTWEQKSITIAGDTTGTWGTGNGSGIQLTFGLGVGTTYSGTAGAWSGTNYLASATGATSVVGTNGATFYVTGVQLEVGSGASDFEFLPIDIQLRRCQRYFYKGLVICVATGAIGLTPNRTYPVYLRTGGSYSFSYGGVANRVYRTSDAGLRDLVSPVINGDVESLHTFYAFTPANWASGAGGIAFNLEVNAEL